MRGKNGAMTKFDVERGIGDFELDELAALHAEVDCDTQALAALHAERLVCRRGCSDCCVDGLTVVRLEAERIRRAHRDLLEAGAPHPEGACAFLDEQGACRIYAERPLVCRVQGLPLRVLFENDEDEIEERRDVCPKNFTRGPALASLAERDCWLVGPHELRLTRLDQHSGGSDETRIALRDLFRRRA